MLIEPLICVIALFAITGNYKINFKFQPKVCNSCNDLMQKSMSFNDVAIISAHGNY